jgi:hypothetical protein
MNKIKKTRQGNKRRKKERTKVQTKDHTPKCTHLLPKENLVLGVRPLERALQKLKTTQVQKICGVSSSEGQLGLGVPNFQIVRGPCVLLTYYGRKFYNMVKVTSSVRPLDTGINQLHIL